MHRIDTEGNVGNLFFSGNESVKGTLVSSDWLNDVQENIMAILASAGITATKGRSADLLDSINKLIAQGAGNDLADKDALRLLAGAGAAAVVVRVLDSDGSGNADYWFKDPNDESSLDDGTNVIVDTDGNRWKKQISGAWIPYATGETLESLKPAQAGADVTGSNTSANTLMVGSTEAAIIESGSLTGVDLQNELNANNFVTSIGQFVAATEQSAENLQLNGLNINNWNASWIPSDRSVLFHLKINKASRTVTVSLRGFNGHTGTANVRFELEIFGNNIAAYTNIDANAILSNKGSNVDFAADSNVYGPNGFVWIEGLTNTSTDIFTITLSGTVDNTTSFRTRLVNFSTDDVSANRYIAYGDTPLVLNPVTPLTYFASPDDTSDHDVLIMRNAPADSGATNRKTFTRATPPDLITDDLHEGDLWIDTDDDNKLYHWNGAAWVQVRDGGAQAGSDLVSDSGTTIHQSSLGGVYGGGLVYADDSSIESLKPAEAGAQIFTGKSITLLSDTSADNISINGSGTVQDIINGLVLPSNSGFERGSANSVEIPEGWSRNGSQATSRTQYYQDAPSNSPFGSKLSYGAKLVTQNGGSVGWWKLTKKFQIGSHNEDLGVSVRVWTANLAVPATITRTEGVDSYFGENDAYITVSFYRADGTLISTHHSDTISQQIFDKGNETLPITITEEWITDTLDFNINVPSQTFRADIEIVAVGFGNTIQALGSVGGSGLILFDDFTWSYSGELNEVTEATWASEPGATHGALWGSNISGQPSDGDLLNAQQLWTEISGAGKPEDNATNRKTFAQDEVPVNPADDINSGDLWIDTNDNNHLYRFNGSSWISLRDGGITQALNDAATALASTSAGALTTFLQPTQPQGRADGDLWFDTSNNKRINRYNFSTPQLISGDSRNFSTSLGDWSDTSAGSGGDITHDNVNEEMILTSDGVDFSQSTITVNVTAETGYEVKFDISSGGDDASIRVGSTSGSGDLLDETFTTGNAKTERMYFATGVGQTTIYLSIRNSNNQSISIDDITLRKEGEWAAVDDDRIAQVVLAASTAQSTADGKIITFIDSVTPTASAIGDLWWDTDEKILKRWDGNNWDGVSITGTSELVDDANLKTNIFAQATEPVASSTGDLWFDTTDNINLLHRWDGASWIEVQDKAITTALNDAANAQDTADGKIVSFFQNDMPVGGTLGDLWFDLDDNKKLYRHDGVTFVETDDARIGTLVTDVATAQSTADSKILTFFQETSPSADGIGDLWFQPSTQITKRWDGDSWENYSLTLTSKLVDDAHLKTQIFRQTTAPANPADNLSTGDLWIDITEGTNLLYWWDGDSWETSRDAGIQQALNNASTAQDTADNKIISYFQPTMPLDGTIGDLWFDDNDNNKLYRHNGITFVETDDARIGTLVSELTTFEGILDNKVTTFFQASTPSASAIGDLWYDTDDAKIRRWDGTSWIIVSTNTKVFVQPTEPTNPTDDLHTGDLWYDSDNGNLPSYWSGSDWVTIRDQSITQALNNASIAQETADGKITAFYQPAQPTTGMSIGDLWFDTDAGNRLHRYDGATWNNEITDTRVAQAISNAETAQSTADSKIETFFTSNNTAPASPSSGDLWYDTTTELLKRWSGSAWVVVSNSFVNTSKFIDDAGLGETALWALVTGEGRPQDSATNSKVFYGPDAPSNPSDDLHDGDIWFDTSDENRMHRFTSSAWVDVSDAGAAAGRDLLAALQSAGLNQNIVDLVSTSNTASETLALASVNVGRWNEIYSGGGTRGIFLSITIIKDSTDPNFKRVSLGLYGRNNHTGTGTLKFELEVFNNTIASYSSNTFQGNVTNKIGGLDFTESGETFWGPNGIVTEQSNVDGIDRIAHFVLTDDPANGTVFRLRVREFETTDVLGKTVIGLGDTPVLAEQTAPYQFMFTPNDTTDQDVLIMRNSPAQAGATNSKTFVRDNPPTKIGDNIHDGDLWVDSNDGNKLYRWSDISNGGTDEWQEVVDQGSVSGRELTLALIDQGVNANIAEFVSDSTLAAEGYPSAANNVNNWESAFTTNDRSTILNVYFDKTSKRLYLKQIGVNVFVNNSTLDLSIEVFGNSIEGHTQGTKTTPLTESPGGIDFETPNAWGPNGFRWTETISGSEEKLSYFTLTDTPSQTTHILIRVISWDKNDVLAKKIIALGDTSIAVDPSSRLRFLTTITDGTDMDVLIMNNAPSAAGADVTAPRAAIKINYSDFSQSNPGEAYVHGFDSSGLPADVPAKILIGSNELSLSDVNHRTIFTSIPNTAGYIVFDSTLSNKFDLDSLASKSIVFAQKTNGGWVYDDNSQWISFTPQSTDVVIGTLVTGASDNIASADIWAYPMSMGVVSEAGATNSKVFSQDDIPTDNILNNLHVGDIWVDTDNGNKLHRWDGSQWIDVQDFGATVGQQLIEALTNQGLNPDIANFVSSTNLATEYIPIASNNVLRWWEGPYIEVNEGSLFRVRINRSTKQIELKHEGVGGHSGTSVFDFELHVSGNTISSISGVSVEDVFTEVPGGIDFNTEDQWGPNGIRWRGSVTAANHNTLTLVLSEIIGSATLFTLRIREHSSGSGDRFLAFGSDLIATNYNTPSTLVFHANDSTSQDVLLMQNAPAQSGATNSKVIAQDDAPSQAVDGSGNRYLNDGDLWIDTDDSNILRRWSDPDNDGTGLWQLVRDEGALFGSDLQENLSNIGKTISDIVDVTQAKAIINVADWNGDFTPLGNGHKLHLKINKQTNIINISWGILGSSIALKNIRLEFEVVAGNTISAFDKGTFSSTYTDNGTVTFPWSQTEWGSNGVNISENVSSGVKTCTITLADTITPDNLFRLKIIELDSPEIDEHNHVIYGNTPFLFDTVPPVVNFFNPIDGSEYDVLLMQNAPAEAGATNTKTFLQSTQPTNPTGEIHIGDFWIDSGDQNKLYRWDGSLWILVRDAGATVGEDLITEISSLGVDSDLAEFVLNTTDATKRVGYSLDNVNDWSTYFNLSTRATLLRTKINKSTGQIFVSVIGTGGHTGSSIVKGELEIIGNTITGATATGMTTVNSGGDIDFDNEADRIDNNLLWGGNGGLFTSSISNTNSVEFILNTGTGSISSDVKFELRIREFTDNDNLAISAVSFGDRVNIIKDPSRSFSVTFAVIDSEDYDVLLMYNAPAEAGADVTGNNTSNDTNNVGGTDALDVAQGSGNAFAHDFEVGEFSLWTSPPPGEYTISPSTDSFSGTQSGRFSTAGANPATISNHPTLFLSNSFATNFSGETVKLTFWHKNVIAEEPSGTSSVYIGMNSAVLGMATFSTTSSWQKETLKVTIPNWDGVSPLHIVVVPSNSASTGVVHSILIDRITIEKIQTETEFQAALLQGAGALVQETVVSRAQSSAVSTIFDGVDPGVWKDVGANISINATGDDPVIVSGSMDLNISQINDTSQFGTELIRYNEAGISGWTNNGSFGGVRYAAGSGSAAWVTFWGGDTAIVAGRTYACEIHVYPYAPDTTYNSSANINLSVGTIAPGSPFESGVFWQNFTTGHNQQIIYTFLVRATTDHIRFNITPVNELAFHGMIEKAVLRRSFAGSGGVALSPPQAGPGGPTLRWRMLRNGTSIYESGNFQVSGAGQIFSPIVDVLDENPVAGSNTYSLQMIWSKSVYSGGVVAEWDIHPTETGIVIGSGTQWASNISAGWTVNGWDGIVANVTSDNSFIFESYTTSGNGGSFAYGMTASFNSLKMTKNNHTLQAIEYRNGG